MTKSLYIHIPFCKKLCSYCDFPKLQFFRSFAVKYIEQLEKELIDTVKNKELDTIYIGGGTPTSLDDDLFLELLKMVRPYSNVVKEYTIEANPESLSIEKLKMMKQYGVNRISIGVESTDNNILKLLNRDHTFEMVKEVVKNIKDVGIDNFNFDLILGLPHVSKEMLLKDLDNLVALNPNHISTYSLTVHEHTKFGLEKVEEPEEDFAYDLYKTVHDYLLNRGYIHYEVSNFAKPQYESKHNLVYWRNEEYYGVGLAAAGYLNNIRYKNTDNLTKYLNGENEKEIEELSLKDQYEYQIMLNLRTNEGLDLDYLKEKFKVDLLKEKQDTIEKYIKSNHLILNQNRLTTTFDGRMILDRIILDLI